jgi:hypothetical protein
MAAGRQRRARERASRPLPGSHPSAEPQAAFAARAWPPSRLRQSVPSEHGSHRCSSHHRAAAGCRTIVFLLPPVFRPSADSGGYKRRSPVLLRKPARGISLSEPCNHIVTRAHRSVNKKTHKLTQHLCGHSGPSRSSSVKEASMSRAKSPILVPRKTKRSAARWSP